LARLKAVAPQHLRVDVNLAGHGYIEKLKRVAAEAKKLAAQLEVGLLIPAEDADAAVQAFRAEIDKEAPSLPVQTWLVYPHTENVWTEPPTATCLKAARAHLASYNKKAIFAAGTNADFIFANRFSKALGNFDAFCTPMNPQVHAFDVASIAETMAAQGIVLGTAKLIAKRKPVLVTPITLRMRWNPYVSPSNPASAANAVPMSDTRQVSLFGAGFTLGSLKYVAQGGARSVTYYETTGERGLLANDATTTVSVDWPQTSGVYPLYHVLADVAEFGATEMLLTKSSEPLAVEGLALKKGKKKRVLLANVTDVVQKVTVSGLGSRATLKLLDETSAEAATQTPERWRKKAGKVVKTEKGKLTVKLLPFGLARIDA
jgi:hypothetical protein